MEEIDRTSISAFGGSLYARLPTRVCRVMGVEKGTDMRVYRDDNRLVFEKVVE